MDPALSGDTAEELYVGAIQRLVELGRIRYDAANMLVEVPPSKASAKPNHGVQALG